MRVYASAVKQQKVALVLIACDEGIRGTHLHTSHDILHLSRTDRS